MSSTGLPVAPFNGQVFIDAYGMKWIYDSDLGCWARSGQVRDIPEATSNQAGLLNPRLKTLIDSIPEAGGHFSIIVDTKLLAIPHKHDTIRKDSVIATRKTNSGSEIDITEGTGDDPLEPNTLAGKAILFTTGFLKGRTFLIYDNDETTLFLEGPDPSIAKVGDKLEIVDIASLNKDGLIQGDIKLLSNSLDITFVDGKGEILENCDTIVHDSDNPPGINIEVSDLFINEFCMILPHCKGPRGERGPKGPKGKDGTGDGPVGEDGDPGQDITEPEDFAGVKILDVEDIYDTAVVSVELDAPSGKLHIVKARMKVPDNNQPADQVIATSVTRGIQFTDDGFGYQLVMPNNDPIGDEDISLMHYTEGFKPKLAAGDNVPESTQTRTVNLTSFIDSIVSLYQAKLDKISSDYDEEIKPFIEEKDKTARTILANLANEVAQCEWDIPLEFCLGIEPVPEGCNPEEEDTVPFPPGADILGTEYIDAVRSPMPPVTIIPGEIPPESREPDDPVPETREPTDPVPDIGPRRGDILDINEDFTANVTSRYQDAYDRSVASNVGAVPIKWIDGSTDLPAGTYIVQWQEGSGTAGKAYNASVTVEYSDDAGSGSVSFSEPDIALLNNWDKNAYETARKDASIEENTVSFTLASPGKATAKWTLDGTNPAGEVKLQPSKVFKSDEAQDAPMPISQTIVRGTVDVDGFPSGGECNQTVDCGEFSNTVNCPSCPGEFFISEITPVPIPASTPTPVTLVGTGFVHAVRLFIDNIEYTSFITAQTVTTVLVDLDLAAGTYDIQMQMDETGQVAYAPNGITAV